jgi:hypothetical protein
MRLKYLRIVMLALGMILMVGSAGIFARNHFRTTEARSWPRARGRVVESRVATVQAEAIGTPGEFFPLVRYDYSAGGHVHHGHVVWLDENRTFDSAAVASRELVSWEAGAEVEVMYNPRDPAEAALLVDKPGWRYFFLFLLGALLTRLGWPKRRPRAQSGQELVPA